VSNRLIAVDAGRQRSRFTQTEALTRIGLRVRARADFPGVPAGTGGRVVAMSDEVEPGRYDLLVEWEVAAPARAVRDYFTRDEFERLLWPTDDTDRAEVHGEHP